MDMPSGVTNNASLLAALGHLDSAIELLDEAGMDIAAAHADAARELLKAIVGQVAEAPVIPRQT